MNPPRNLERRDSDGRLIPYSQFAAPDDPTPWPRQFTLATRSVMAIMELVTIGYLGYYTQIMRNDGRDPRTGLAFAGVILAAINDGIVTYVAYIQRYTGRRNGYATLVDLVSAALGCAGATLVGWDELAPSDPWVDEQNTARNLVIGVYGLHIVAAFCGLIVCCGHCAKGSREGEEPNDIELATPNPAWSGVVGIPGAGGVETEPLDAGPSAPGPANSSGDGQEEVKDRRQSVASAGKVFHIDAPREISGAGRPNT